ncbi:MAG TPA: helix-turn-helix domain-containing protein [Ktedonosporobacter sp.]|nr:helix-turn-helix domain-containing protein [Ktedonosporobacter sp.]
MTSSPEARSILSKKLPVDGLSQAPPTPETSTLSGTTSPAGGAATKPLLTPIKGRGKEACSEEARKRILDAAQTLFAAHGFNATTTKAIAEQAGVPSGLIFYYFPTKQALLKSMINERNILIELRASLDIPGDTASQKESEMCAGSVGGQGEPKGSERGADTGEVPPEQTTDPASVLIALGTRYLSVMQQHKELGCILLREFRSQPDLADQFHELRQEHIRLIASYLQDAFEARQRRRATDSINRSLPTQGTQQDGTSRAAPTQANIEAIARTFLYNLIMIGMIEDPPEPLRLVEEMVSVLCL